MYTSMGASFKVSDLVRMVSGAKIPRGMPAFYVLSRFVCKVARF